MEKIPKLKDLSPDVQDAIKNKARWERMSLTAVMVEWPELWKDDAGMAR